MKKYKYLLSVGHAVQVAGTPPRAKSVTKKKLVVFGIFLNSLDARKIFLVKCYYILRSQRRPEPKIVSELGDQFTYFRPLSENFPEIQKIVDFI